MSTPTICTHSPLGCSVSTRPTMLAGRKVARPFGSARPALPTRSVRCYASTLDSSRPVYQGRFGPFQILPSDEQEVLLYRLGINVAAAGV